MNAVGAGIQLRHRDEGETEEYPSLKTKALHSALSCFASRPLLAQRQFTWYCFTIFILIILGRMFK